MAVILAGMAIGTGTARADAAADLAETLFGKAVVEAGRTSETADDAALARQILQVARRARGAPDLVAVLCEQAYALVADVPGQEALAAQAMSTLADLAPDRGVGAYAKLAALGRDQLRTAADRDRPAASAQLLDVLLSLSRAQMRSGAWSDASETLADALALAEGAVPARKGDVEAGQAHMDQRRAASATIARYQQTLAGDPTDARTRRRLVCLLIETMDNPQAASEVVSGVGDEILRTYVPLAAMGPDALAPTAALEVGQWYVTLADQHSGPTRRIMLRRAEGFLERAARAGRGDLRGQADRYLGQVSTEITGMSAPAMTHGTHELIDRLDLTADVRFGAWRPSAVGPKVEMTTRTRLLLPVIIDGSYQVQLQVMRLDGTGPVYVILPVGPQAVMLVLDADGLSGLTQIDGQGIQEGNPTRKQGCRLGQGRPVAVTVRVMVQSSTATIQISAGNQLRIEWSGNPAQLSLPRGVVPLAVGRLAMGTYNASAAFSSAALTMIEGTARDARVR